MPEIKIVPYKPDWPAEYERLAAALKNALGELALRIDHIGSTAVPGLAAKDRIDIQISVGALTPELIESLTNHGYIHKPGLEDTPRGENPDPGDWRKLVFVTPDDERPANIHLREWGRPNQRYALLFRDFLRAHPISRDGYAKVKEELARLHPHDKDVYYAVKEPVFDIIHEAMEMWAEYTGWNPA
ncbi:MAG: GrpB family protein [Chloroflexi bacterium]|nr:MAG: GrpB family protein [Chloroflexota bacterium]MBL1195592.1 GrpB family protein [Chloroflexota bacterium]NOH12879.1 GrpB family protein [Chloroflexota bacterium]